MRVWLVLVTLVGCGSSVETGEASVSSSTVSSTAESASSGSSAAIEAGGGGCPSACSYCASSCNIPSEGCWARDTELACAWDCVGPDRCGAAGVTCNPGVCSP